MAKDFTNFEIEDFAFDETFQNWVLVPNSEFRSFWEQYLSSHPLQTDKILAARTLVLELQSHQPVPDDVDLADSIWQTIQDRIRPRRRRLLPYRPGWQWAASVVFLLGITAIVGAIYFNQNQLHFPAVASLPIRGEVLEEVNRTRDILKIHLSDGSVVSLGRNSRLTYPREFNADQREVHLSGEAFFEVYKNPNQPFLVFADETVTKVLGTSFRIKAYAGSPKVIVEVRTGRVSVFAKKDFEKESTLPERKGLVLTPNQQAVFNRDLSHLDKTLIEVPVILASPTERISFEFNNTPLDQIFQVLEKAYGVEIIYEPEVVEGRSLTVGLEDESLYDKLDVICKTLRLSYQIVDAQIIIENKNPRK
jgi:transmembrane sensor